MKSLVLIFLCLYPTLTFANWDGKFISPSTQKNSSLYQVLSTIQPGQVILMGEQHDYLPDHNNQTLFLQQLALSNSSAISVGMEFFEYPFQSIVDEFLAGKLADADFLKQVGWGGDDFSQYRFQVLFPVNHGGSTYALNLPRAISGRIATVGVEALTAAESAFLPPNFTIGRKSYQDRFVQMMADSHQTLPPQDLQHYFEAQSSWDDTMAWRISEIMRQNPQQILFVIVGKFHVQYGGGLPDRLQARGVKNILTITQYAASDGGLDDFKNLTQPDPVYGPISDLVWIQGEPK